MTRQELSQFYYLNKLRVETEQELDKLLQERSAKIMPIDDMPHAKGGISQPTEVLAIAIAEQIEIVRGVLVNCQKKEKEIWSYIESLEKTDSYLAALVKYRCINNMSWEQVARRIGGTGDSCRMYFNRKIPR